MRLKILVLSLLSTVLCQYDDYYSESSAPVYEPSNYYEPSHLDYGYEPAPVYESPSSTYDDQPEYDDYEAVKIPHDYEDRYDPTTHYTSDEGPWRNDTYVTSYVNTEYIPSNEKPHIQLVLDLNNLFNSHINLTIPRDTRIDHKETFVENFGVNYDERTDAHDGEYEKSTEYRDGSINIKIG